MKKIKKILIIIQRSNGDVFFSLSLIQALYENYESPQIDLLVNEDTLPVAHLLSPINYIHTFSYIKKKKSRWTQEKQIIGSIFRKYDLSINLTASDRSVLYAIFAAKKSISAIEKDYKKSWWKKILLTSYYYFNSDVHILSNNLESLNILKIDYNNILANPSIQDKVLKSIKNRLINIGVNNFVIFHPSAQYSYKIYPQQFRDELLSYLSTLGVSVLITGGKTQIDREIKKTIPSLPNIINLIGETSLEEYFALSSLSIGYIGMDTLNMHIAAAQNKRIFAIFGPTNLSMWSPWSNQLRKATSHDIPLQNYGNVTIFQANLPCVACGNAGCDDNHGKSICLDNISPKAIFDEIKNWYFNNRI